MASSSSDVDAEIQAVLGQLKAEGHIDDQFQQLLLLQDESDPDFVRSVMQLFFEVRLGQAWLQHMISTQHACSI